MKLLEGKRALITGVAGNRSIAWGIARVMRREGAELAFTYQNERLRGRVEELAAQCGATTTLPCDVQNDAEIAALFAELGARWPRLDVIVHSIAYAPREELGGDYVNNASRAGFTSAHETSCYSLTALAAGARPLMQERGALLTLTYYGAEKVVPNYNVMGLAKASLEANVRYLADCLGREGTRVNAISAGPIKTLAAAGIGDFRKMLEHVERNAPLRKNVSIEEVGNAAAFLCSDYASGVTGEVLHVDAGYNLLGMSRL